jgi:hypothetical protein
MDGLVPTVWDERGAPHQNQNKSTAARRVGWADADQTTSVIVVQADKHGAVQTGFQLIKVEFTRESGVDRRDELSLSKSRQWLHVMFFDAESPSFQDVTKSASPLKHGRLKIVTT